MFNKKVDIIIIKGIRNRKRYTFCDDIINTIFVDGKINSDREIMSLLEV